MTIKLVRTSASKTEMSEIVLPSHANNLGTVFGGVVMQWIDACAAMAAQRHCRRTVVTAAVDELQFLMPIHLGDIVILSAQVNAAFKTSMEVGVRVDAEDPKTGHRRKCLDALVTFVALDDDGKPTQVPPVVPETDEDRQRLQEARARRAERLAKRPAK